MAEMVEEHAHQVYIKDVKFYSTIVTAASEEDAKWKALREHTTLEGYEHLDSSLVSTPDVVPGGPSWRSAWTALATSARSSPSSPRATAR